MPGGQVQLQPPPQLQPNEGAAGVAMNAIPMLGSLGSIVLVATLSGGGGNNAVRGFLTAGMFLFATLGFIFVQIDRQKKQRAQQVTGSRTEYLRYLATVRTMARDAADRSTRVVLNIQRTAMLLNKRNFGAFRVRTDRLPRGARPAPDTPPGSR